jgi:hypothetical protein
MIDHSHKAHLLEDLKPMIANYAGLCQDKNYPAAAKQYDLIEKMVAEAWDDAFNIGASKVIKAKHIVDMNSYPGGSGMRA